MTAIQHRHPPVLAAFAASGALLLSACGSGGSADAISADGVATLEGSDTSAADAEAATDATEMTPDESALALSQCLRDQGLDVPDIGLDANGNIDLRGALQDIGPGDASFRDAIDECSDILEGIGFGAGQGRAALADDAEFQDALLEFSDCIRSNGFEDIPDLSLGGGPQGGGQTPQADGSIPDGAGPGRGTPEGGFGDRSSRFAERLGLDSGDPAVITALDECSPIIDQAFGDAGIGQPGQPAAEA